MEGFDARAKANVTMSLAGLRGRMHPRTRAWNARVSCHPIQVQPPMQRTVRVRANTKSVQQTRSWSQKQNGGGGRWREEDVENKDESGEALG